MEMERSRFASYRRIGARGRHITLTADEGMAAAPIAPSGPAGRMEIALVGGERVVVGADVDAAALARVVKALSRR